MKYKLPIASDDELGGVKVGNDFEIDEDGTLNVKNMDQMQETVQELVDNVGTGKALIAEAITEKGVSTAEDATFQEMAGNISRISIGNNGAVYTGVSHYLSIELFSIIIE